MLRDATATASSTIAVGGYGSLLRAQQRTRQERRGEILIQNNSQQRAPAKPLLRVSGDCVSRSALDVNGWAATQPPMNAHAHHEKSSVAAISIFASAGMAAAKFVVGILIGSLALISEALHSSVDVVATVITWLVVQVSDRPADEEHHYGHGKLESVSALFVIAMLYALAGR